MREGRDRAQLSLQAFPLERARREPGGSQARNHQGEATGRASRDSHLLAALLEGLAFGERGLHAWESQEGTGRELGTEPQGRGARDRQGF